jgi:hypothetical protein
MNKNALKLKSIMSNFDENLYIQINSSVWASTWFSVEPSLNLSIWACLDISFYSSLESSLLSSLEEKKGQ